MILIPVVVAGAVYWITSRSAPPEEVIAEEVIVVAAEPSNVPGYDRACGTGHGCVFGPAWSDDVNVRLGHNGCDTRNDILGEALTAVIHREGTKGCVVIAGDLSDPYTGAQIHFEKANASQVQIDHIYPLAVAWDRGAHSWSSDQRRNFANDPDNLVATGANANQSKSDHTPAKWLPGSAAGKCRYVTGFVAIARKYQLPITSDEARVVAEVGKDCG